MPPLTGNPLIVRMSEANCFSPEKKAQFAYIHTAVPWFDIDGLIVGKNIQNVPTLFIGGTG